MNVNTLPKNKKELSEFNHHDQSKKEKTLNGLNFLYTSDNCNNDIKQFLNCPPKKKRRQQQRDTLSAKINEINRNKKKMIVVKNRPDVFDDWE